MAYLSCPDCGATYFDRNPLVSPHHCPRCAISRKKTVELKRSTRRDGAAAASLLTPPVSGASEDAPGEATSAAED